MLDDLGLRDAVRDLAHDLADRSGFELRLELRLDGPDPDSQTGTAAYRIVQEALTNVARHAQAKHVGIAMLSDDKQLKIVITDDGIGLDIAAAEAADALERSAADVIIWGRRTWLGKLDLRLTTLPAYGRTHDVQEVQLGWRVGRPDELVQRALAFALARNGRAR